MVWGCKYHDAEEGKKIHRIIVPKSIQKDPAKFEIFIDKNSGEDSAMRIRKPGMWREFY